MEKKTTSKVGIFAGLFLGILCISVAAHSSWTLLHLLNNGRHAEAKVVAIKTGAKGSKKAQVTFRSAKGTAITAEEMFQMILIRHKRGDQVTVIYDPASPKRVIIDTGPWVWQQPVLLCLGGIFLIGLISFLAIKES